MKKVIILAVLIGAAIIGAQQYGYFNLTAKEMQTSDEIVPWDVDGKDTITTSTGLKYVVLKSNPEGHKIVKGSKVKVHYSGFLMDGKLFDSSFKRGQPLPLTVGKGQVIAGWDEGIALFKQGERGKLIIPYNLAYGERGMPPTIPAKADLIFDIEIVEVEDPIEIKPFDINGLEMKTTASGLKYYEVNRSGSDTKAQAQRSVKVHYTGYLANGQIFDSSIERGQAITFTLGVGQVIPGWDEGIGLMSVGDKLRLVIPYQLAYGEAGRAPVIPPKAELTFDVELMAVH